MSCKRCPHHVRHGQSTADGKGLEFIDKCALKIQQGQTCPHYPFAKAFDYTHCEIYRTVFKSSVARNDVVPTQDFQYSDSFAAGAITDMELL